jgi:hypothetical protein
VPARVFNCGGRAVQGATVETKPDQSVRSRRC